MTATELGKLFIKYYPPDEKGFSSIALMSDLIKINSNFKTSNGNNWARDNISWLGRKYKIERKLKNGSIFSVQLIGFNENSCNHGGITAEIRRHFKNAPCCVTGCIHNSMEIDHKNGQYDKESYSIEDFQSLCKTVNDAKREWCAKCRLNNKRFDATILGYSVSYTQGDENRNYGCKGCYWNDPKKFNKIISSAFNKPEE